MRQSTIGKLNTINRQFYREVGVGFDRTRRSPWQGWAKLLELMDSKQEKITLLDVGCGNGRLIRYVDKQMGVSKIEAVGVDSAGYILQQARQLQLEKTEANWVKADVVLDGLPETVKEGAPYDVVTLMGVLHHVPGFETRVKLLQRLYRLLSPTGMLVMSFWQFGADERFEKKKIDWEDYVKRSGIKLDLNDLEAGDFLLTWENDPDSVRYCHFVDWEEYERMKQAVGAVEMLSYYADGKTRRLNLYGVWKLDNG